MLYNILGLIISLYAGLYILFHTNMIGHSDLYYTHFPCIVGMGFPLFFNMERKDLRNIGITISVIAIILSMKWIAFVCLFITGLVLLKRYMVVVLLILTLLIIPLSAKIHRTGFGSPFKETIDRITLYNDLTLKWDKVWLGHGLNTFQNLPGNQPTTNKIFPGLWTRCAESDWLQGLYELGILRMIPILIFILLPLLWWKPSPIGAGYLCVIFQGLIDFPFHRWTTGIVGLVIILMMSREKLNVQEI